MQSNSVFLRGATLKAVPVKGTTRRRFCGLLQTRAVVVSSNDLKNGMTLEVNNQPFKVIEFLHVKPGKGAAFVRSKLKNCVTGSVIDKTFRAGEMLTTAEVRRDESQFTYVDGPNYVFMDVKSYEETRVEKDDSWAKYVTEGTIVTLTFYQDKVIGVDPPKTVEMKVIASNTGSGGNHPVTLETGAVIQAPLFIKAGDVIKIDTKREVYLSRA